MKLILPQIVSAENDILIDDEGRHVVDLFSANGTAWLGHCNPAISKAVAEQLQRVWITGGLGTATFTQAKAAIEDCFPPSHQLAALYSTGMEAAEFAIRIARAATGRNQIVGFEKSMHGKSMATAFLGWDNHDGLTLPNLHRLPFVPAASEDQILTELEQALQSRAVSAVLIEPIQGSGGGHMASPRFYQEATQLCRTYGALSIFDEILSGFHRTGKPFLFDEFSVSPDMILIGKSIGNGFPVSGVIARRDIEITPAMLPGSTFAGNPLAAAAVVATLKQMKGLNLADMVAAIEQVILQCLSDLPKTGVALRGKGAIWIMELPERLDAQRIVTDAYKKGAFVNFTGRLIRVLPAATISLENLRKGCTILRESILGADHG